MTVDSVQVGEKLTMTDYISCKEEIVKVVSVWEYTFSVRDVRGNCHLFHKSGRSLNANWVEVSR